MLAFLPSATDWPQPQHWLSLGIRSAIQPVPKGPESQLATSIGTCDLPCCGMQPPLHRPKGEQMQDSVLSLIPSGLITEPRSIAGLECLPERAPVKARRSGARNVPAINRDFNVAV